jgi:hypothetical protein
MHRNRTALWRQYRGIVRRAYRERGLLPRDDTDNLSAQLFLLEARVARGPPVAMSYLVATVGSYGFYRTIARDHDVAGTVLGPRACIRRDAPLSAERPRPPKRAYHLDDGAFVGMVVNVRRRENQDHVRGSLKICAIVIAKPARTPATDRLLRSGRRFQARPRYRRTRCGGVLPALLSPVLHAGRTKNLGRVSP